MCVVEVASWLYPSECKITSYPDIPLSAKGDSRQPHIHHNDELDTQYIAELFLASMICLRLHIIS